MEFVEVQGRGKFAVASRSIQEGEIVCVSAAHVVVFLPRSPVGCHWCIGCLSRLYKQAPKAACCFCCTAGAAAATTADDGNVEGHPCCPDCSGQYCSAECLRSFSARHRSRGECAVLAMMMTNRSRNHTDDCDLLAVAILIARAQAEGFELPTGGAAPPPEQQQGNVKDERHEMEEVSFVQSAPRECISSVFPEMIKKFKKKQRNGGLEEQTPATTPAAAATVFSVPLSRRSALSSTFQKQDAETRLSAIVSSASPETSSLDFFENVSNARLKTAAELGRVAKLFQRYKSIAASAATEKGVTPPAFAPQVSWECFLHFYSTMVSNCFAYFDPVFGRHVGVGIFPSASYFNHCCSRVPNLCHRDGGRGGNMVFYANRDIEAGEDLCIDYGSLGDRWPEPSKEHTAKRREYLLKNYRFWCCCETCAASEDPPAAAAAAAGKRYIKRVPVAGRCKVCAFDNLRRRILVDDVEKKERICVAEECRYCFDFVEVK